MYKAYAERNDSPFLRSVIYVSILELFILAIASLFLKEAFIRVKGMEVIDFEKPFYVWSIAGFLLLASFIYYSRKDISELEKRFENRHTLNKNVHLIGGVVAYVFTFGGVIFGRSINGLF